MNIKRNQIIFSHTIVATWMLCILLLASCSPKKKDPGARGLEDVQLSTLNGERIDMDEFEGKTVFINFWATWCRPCIQEMPSIAALQTQLAGKNIQFFFASDEEVDRIQKFMESRKMTLNFVRVENPESLGIQALPTTFIFDGEGNMVFSEVGFRKWDDPATIEMVNKLINDDE